MEEAPRAEAQGRKPGRGSVMLRISRRQFAVNLASFAAASALPSRVAGVINPPLYPPIDLSYFDSPVTPAPADIRFGYAAITWGGADTRAISEICEVGFRG